MFNYYLIHFMKEEVVAQATESRLDVNINGYQVQSPSDVRLEEAYNLAKGEELTVLDAEGNVIFENLRAFMPVDEKSFLIRKQDGLWYLRSIKKERRLQKVNLLVRERAMMFDERGKMHLSQVSPHYKNICA